MSTEEFDAQSFLKHCTSHPGVYQMYDAGRKPLYIGKAKNLKKRLSSYFRSGQLEPKTAALVKKIAHIDVTLTNSETEALILEQNLIKADRPPYNILLRDDKSYPYIYLSSHQEYPRLSFHRGAKRKQGEYFGPFPNSHAVRESLSLLQKMFKVRQCEDSFFRNRARPCLQHQIGRCSAPCVGLADTQDYTESVRQSVMFLDGHSNELNREIETAMEKAAEALDFERAAECRDQIALLRRIQEKQFVDGKQGDIDIVACAMRAGKACVQVLYIRRGRMLGSRSYYPAPGIIVEPAELLEAFLSQLYLTGSAQSPAPGEIIVSVKPANASALEEVLTEASKHQVKIRSRVRAGRSRWLEMACKTAEQNLTVRINDRQQVHQRFELLREELQLDDIPERIECFDISHSSGEQTVASCVVFDREGARKGDYRKFNIEDITAGDDYAAMRQALERRYTRLKKGEGLLPDILLIDGGKGQLGIALDVMEELQVSEVLVIGVAKGEGRKPGLETLYVGAELRPVNLEADAVSLHLVQQIRDEAHRFAITGHRARRQKKRNTSPLENIPGIGPGRRRNLLKHFGGWQEIERASIDDLVKVDGISRKIAEDIYATIHRQ